MKLDATFYRHTLLPNVYKAKQEGVDILSKSALLAHFRDQEAEKFWVCCASAQDIEETNEIVSAMESEKHDVLASLDIKQSFESSLVSKKLLKVVSSLRKEGKNELADKLYTAIHARQKSNIDDLNFMLWRNSEFKLVYPEKATNEDIKKLAKQAKEYLQKKTNADDELIEEAVLDFIDQNYLSDVDFKGNIKPTQILAADLYYKNRGDELDELELNSDVSEKEIELGMRELKRYL